MQLRPADFAHYFRAIHCHDPFPWQQALVDLLAADDSWPPVLDLPTGAGKTAALDVAVFHLALRADTPWDAALRIALVVDRRLVVDDAFERATRIARTLAEALPDAEFRGPVVREVARRLQHLAGGGDAPPLVARRLRGGAPLEHDWARTPTQPTILCSTVDQVGSRLLFRGYGVSSRMRPVHAGLLGEDSLILLDEAHLSEPFRRTLADVQELGQARVKAVLLSATPGTLEHSPFSLTRQDREHRILKSRLEAAKPARLMKPVRKSPAGAFADTARNMAERLQRGGVSRPAVGIVVNRVDLAREIFNDLKGAAEAPCVCLLMIGRSRAVDRDRIADGLKPYHTDAPGRCEARQLFVVATQCLEVGVDLDLDGLVTQAASLDALRQRFGRLNRAGRDVPAAGAILVMAEDVAKKADDPVYEDRIRTTWGALTMIAEDDQLDFGVTALERRLHEAAIDAAELAAPRARAPVVMPAYLDLWSHTSPPPANDPEVGLFLHGAERAAADVSLVWRGDLSTSDLYDGNGADLKTILEMVPPRTAEMIEVPIWSAAAWLSGRRAARPARIADVPARAEPTASDRGERRVAFRWAGRDDPRTGLVGSADLRPGDVLIVPAHYGGCDEFGWNPDSPDHVADGADEAALPYRHRRYIIRVTRDVVRNDAQWARVAGVLQAADGADGLDLVERLLDALPAAEATDADDEAPEGDPPRPRNVRTSLESLRDAKGGRITRFLYARGHPEKGALLMAPHGLEGVAGEDAPAPVTEDDTLSRTSQRPGQPVTLDHHTSEVVAHVECFTRTLGLREQVAEDLSIAAFLHDAGKADTRFQTLLSGGDWWNHPDGPVMAKSGKPSPPGAWERADLPDGWRHEALSVRMALAHPRFAGAHDPELVLWLIGTHHGLGRPFFGFADPADDAPVPDVRCCLGVDAWQPGAGPGPQSLAFDFHGLDWATMFDRLKRRYGIWGLARLETILRLADHRASERERAP